MTLFSTIQIANNALIAGQLGLQVTGNNIANANTPGYIRQRLALTPAPTQKYGNLLLGLGVQVEGVVQVIDKFLDERMRNATSDLVNGETQANTYNQLESLIGELGDNDLSTSLTSFFGALHDVLNQPESASVRNVAVQAGRALTEDIRRLDSRVTTLHQDVNQQIIGTADEINDLLSQIADLNLKIVSAEGGSVSPSDAVGLRDQRAIAMGKLAEITDIRTIEQPTGDVTIFSGGEFLVNLGIHRTVEVVNDSVNGLPVAEIQIQEIGTPLTAGGGKLAGLIASRDEILGSFLNGLDEFTRALTFEFNRVYSGGQGLTGFASLTSEFGVNNAQVALDQAGLSFTPANGGFQVQVTNSQTGTTNTTDIRVDLNGLGADTTLADIASQLDAIEGISAAVTDDGELRVGADAPEITFALASDTSGTLAALGLNTFFSGDGSSTIGINQVLQADPKKLAMSGGGVAADTQNGLVLANLLTAPLDSHHQESLAGLYDRLTNDVAQAAQTSRGATDGYRVFQQALEAQHQSISGVNLDEEAVRMIAIQRAFQASAKVIATVDEMLDILVNL